MRIRQSLLILLLLAGFVGAIIPLTTTAVWQSNDKATGNRHPVSTGCDWADIDGDGWLDLVVSNGNDIYEEYCAVYFNSTGTLETEPSWMSAPEEFHSHNECADYDKDGDPDLAVAYLGGGNPWSYGNDVVYSNFDDSSVKPYPAWSGTVDHNDFGITWGDYDGDGDLDLAVSGGVDYVNRNEPLRIYRNDNGTLTTTAAWQSDKSTTWMDVLFADFNNDGYLDLAAAAEHDSNVIFLGTGSGLPTTPDWEDADTWDSIRLAAGDLNGDGWMDLAVANNNQSAGQQDIIYFSANGLIDTTPDWFSEPVEMSSFVALADVDNDGDLDLATSGWWADIRIYENHGGSFNTLPEWLSGLGYSPVSEAILFADYDNDGLTSGTDSFTSDGSGKVFQLDVLPFRRVTAVRVGGSPLPVSGYCYGRQEGWVSLGTAPSSGVSVEIDYEYSTDLDLAQTDWDNKPNVIFENDPDSGVELYSFSARRTDDGVLLGWDISAEAVSLEIYRQRLTPTVSVAPPVNNRHYAAWQRHQALAATEYQTDPWELLATLDSSGGDQWLDDAAPAGAIRYLIETTDAGGESHRFAPITIKVEGASNPTEAQSRSYLDNPWPCPADEAISVELFLTAEDAGGAVVVNLYDLAGRRVAALTPQNLSVGRHSLSLPTTSLASGVYLLSLETTSGSDSQSVVIAR